MKVIARCPLEPRRSVYVIEAAGRSFLIGVGEGPMTVLAELDGEKLQSAGRRRCGGAEVRRGAGARAGRDGSPKRGAADVEAAWRRWTAWRLARGALAPALAQAASAAHGHDGGMASRPLVLILAMAALSLIPFALPDGDVVRADLGGAVDPAQRDRDAVGAADAGADRAGDGADHRRDGADRRADVRRHRADAGDGGRRRADQRRDDRGAGDGRRPRQGAAARVPAQAHRRARPGARSTRWRSRCARRPSAPSITDRDFGVIVPAFVTSELRRAFQIGFLLFIPFLVVDMVIANLLLALGMHMLSPTTVSLPFKLLLFVLADGWNLVIRGLLESYL